MKLKLSLILWLILLYANVATAQITPPSTYQLSVPIVYLGGLEYRLDVENGVVMGIDISNDGEYMLSIFDLSPQPAPQPAPQLASTLEASYILGYSYPYLLLLSDVSHSPDDRPDAVFLDITDIYNPFEIQRLQMGIDNVFRVHLEQSVAYDLVTWNVNNERIDQVFIYDLSNPIDFDHYINANPSISTPLLIDDSNPCLFKFISSIPIKNGRLVTITIEELFVYDIESDPLSPVLLTVVDLPGTNCQFDCMGFNYIANFIGSTHQMKLTMGSVEYVIYGPGDDRLVPCPLRQYIVDLTDLENITIIPQDSFMAPQPSIGNYYIDYVRYEGTYLFQYVEAQGIVYLPFLSQQ